MNNQYVLMLGDVDTVKEYVYETSKLPEIRGASEILNELYSEGIKCVFRENGLSENGIIYSGGGSFLAKVPIDKVEKVSQDIEKKYIDKTKVATITIVYSLPISDKELCEEIPQEAVKNQQPLGYAKEMWDSYFEDSPSSRGMFLHILAFLHSELRLKKMQKEYVPFYPALPIMKRCEHCGKRGAVDVIGEEMVCEVCRTKKQSGDKRRFIDKFLEWLGQNGHNNEVKKLKNSSIPQSLEDLGDYIAFVYADGNGIGNLLLKAKKEDDYKKISQNLSKGTENAVFQSLFSILPWENLKKLPFVIVNIGGDDVSLFISSKYAWRFTTEFLENFKNNLSALSNELGEREITASAGVIITKHDYPVIFSEKLASGLLRIAKQKEDSAICHLYLTSHIAETDALKIMKDLYLMGKNGSRRSLSMRPFSLEESKKLQELSQRFEKIYASAQRRGVSEALSSGMWEAINFFLYQTSRLEADNKKEAFELLEEMQSCFGLNKSLVLYSTSRKNIFHEVVCSTPLLDIIELIEFTKKGI